MPPASEQFQNLIFLYIKQMAIALNLRSLANAVTDIITSKLSACWSRRVLEIFSFITALRRDKELKLWKTVKVTIESQTSMLTQL